MNIFHFEIHLLDFLNTQQYRLLVHEVQIYCTFVLKIYSCKPILNLVLQVHQNPTLCAILCFAFASSSK